MIARNVLIFPSYPDIQLTTWSWDHHHGIYRQIMLLSRSFCTIPLQWIWVLNMGVEYGCCILEKHLWTLEYFSLVESQFTSGLQWPIWSAMVWIYQIFDLINQDMIFIIGLYLTKGWGGKTSLAIFCLPYNSIILHPIFQILVSTSWVSFEVPSC